MLSLICISKYCFMFIQACTKVVGIFLAGLGKLLRLFRNVCTKLTVQTICQPLHDCFIFSHMNQMIFLHITLTTTTKKVVSHNCDFAT